MKGLTKIFFLDLEVGPIELRQIEYFEAVSRLKSYTKAARELFITQPSITVAIRKLEEELGVKLIERDNKSLYLTDAGEEFLIHATGILEKVKETTRIMKDIKPEAKKILKLAFPPALGAWMWSVIYPDFITAYPHIDIQVQDLGTLEIIDAIQKGEVELGFGVLETVQRLEMETLCLKKGEIKLLVHQNHPFKALEKVPITLLAEETYIQYKRSTTYIEEKMLCEFKANDIRPEILYVKEQSSAYDLVSKGHGFAVTLDDTIGILKGNPNILSKSFEIPLYFQSGLIWNKDKYLSDSARAFIRFISQRSAT